MIECGSGLGEARVLPFIIFLTTTRYTGVAQRQRAGLITPRSLDRNESPVFIQSSKKTSKYYASPHNIFIQSVEPAFEL